MTFERCASTKRNKRHPKVRGDTNNACGFSNRLGPDNHVRCRVRMKGLTVRVVQEDVSTSRNAIVSKEPPEGSLDRLNVYR